MRSVSIIGVVPKSESDGSLLRDMIAEAGDAIGDAEITGNRPRSLLGNMSAAGSRTGTSGRSSPSRPLPSAHSHLHAWKRPVPGLALRQAVLAVIAVIAILSPR